VGVRKLVPDKDTLASAYRRAWRIAEVNELLKQTLDQQGRDSAAIAIPRSLRKMVADRIKGKALSWDKAVAQIVAEAR
jgi:hypothetical protein